MPPAAVEVDAPRTSRSRSGRAGSSRDGTPRDNDANGTKAEPTDNGGEDTTDAAARSVAQQRHEDDLAKHAYEPPRPTRIQDDWQVAYVWAFIVKFGILGKINKLLSLEEYVDFERSLSEPVANRPEDVLEGILIQFIKHLKPGLRNVDCTNIQGHVSNYISDMLLNSNEFTVWDRPWAPHEEARGACCNSLPDRTELGRLRGPHEERSHRARKNPLVQIERKGGGLFELDWYERARLLRQLVDWQLSHSETIREKIKVAQARKDEANKKTKRKNPEPEDETKKDEDIFIEPIGLDRNKNRIWSVDTRLYKSGNPFKRPCPLMTMTTTRPELEAQREQYVAYGATAAGKVAGSGPKGKPTPRDMLAHRKKLKGIDDERKLGEWIGEFLPEVEKDEARVARARKKVVDTMRSLQAAELRTTRTRRSTRKVDYTYDSFDDDDDNSPAPRGGRRGAATWEPPRRPVIPGERRSGRLAAREEDSYDESSVAGVSAAPSREPSPSPKPESERAPEVFPEGTRKVKGYAWIADAGSSPPSGANGHGHVANGSVGGTEDDAIEVDT